MIIVVDKGRPWTTHEAFELIIKEQVKSLVTNGADPMLEVVVSIMMDYICAAKIGGHQRYTTVL